MAQSLVKYNTPILVVGPGGKGGKSGGKGAKEKSAEATQTEDILNSILPPREWTEDGQLWIQYVSSTPATRLDVVNLQEHLDHALQSRQARETGICPVREELYAQCFGTSLPSFHNQSWLEYIFGANQTRDIAPTNQTTPCPLSFHLISSLQQQRQMNLFGKLQSTAPSEVYCCFACATRPA
jgi:hypothetical protein